MADVDRILDLLMPDYVNKHVLMRHDVARETFKADSMQARDFRDFNDRIADYIQYHHQAVGDGMPTHKAAFAEAMRILNGVFSEDPFREGYNEALETGLRGVNGGMREIFNVLANQLKRHALNAHKDYVISMHVDPRSEADFVELARAYFSRFGSLMRRFAPDIDEKTFAANPRAAIEYHARIIEQILGVGRKF